MSREHIDFSKMERGDPVDEEHLAVCARCRQDQQAHQMLLGMTSRLPEVEPSPYFASRVARLAGAESERSDDASFILLLQRSAQQLLPVFMVLILTVGFLAYQQLDTVETFQGEDAEVAAMLLSEPVDEEVTLDFVLGTLADESLQGGSGDEPN